MRVDASLASCFWLIFEISRVTIGSNSCNIVGL